MADGAEGKSGDGPALRSGTMRPKAFAAAAAAFVRARSKIVSSLDRKILAAGAAGLLLGTAVGFASAPRDRLRDELHALRSEIGAGREETARLFAKVDGSQSAMAGVVESLAAASSEAARRDAAASDRSDRLQRDLATLHEDLRARSDALGRDQAERIADLARTVERRLQEAAQAAQPKPEPARTGSLGEAASAAPATIEDWALREVLDGVATIEDRKRRVVEVARGDLVPGVGRVEAVERRGRSWTVVTKRGLIAPQDW